MVLMSEQRIGKFGFIDDLNINGNDKESMDHNTLTNIDELWVYWTYEWR